MDGIHIISEQMVRSNNMAEIIVVSIMAIVLGAIILRYVYMDYPGSNGKRGAHIIAGIIAVIYVPIALHMISILCKGYRNIHPQYVITIDDSASFNEFYRTYKIISHEGDRYTVELLEEGESK